MRGIWGKNEVVFYAECAASGICRISAPYMETACHCGRRCGGNDGSVLFDTNNRGDSDADVGKGDRVLLLHEKLLKNIIT